MGTSYTVTAVERKGMVLGATIVLALILFSFAGFTYLTMKKTHKRGVTITYSVMLFISLLIFAGIAYMGPSVRGKH